MTGEERGGREREKREREGERYDRSRDREREEERIFGGYVSHCINTCMSPLAVSNSLTLKLKTHCLK